jgi:integrase
LIQQTTVRQDVGLAVRGEVDRRRGLHFHDLRHTGNTFAASSGAGLRDLMAPMGHDSERAAMIYRHEARGVDQAITSAIDTHVQAEQRGEDDDNGPTGVLAPVG